MIPSNEQPGQSQPAGENRLYKKKPVIIEAIQWDGTYHGMKQIEILFPELRTTSCSCHKANNTVTTWSIKTLEGSYYISHNDFIIKGIKGEYYPCKPDIFEKTYEPVSPSPSKEGQQPVKTKHQILHYLLGMRLDAPDNTPMDKGECMMAMETYASQFLSREEELEKEIERLKDEYGSCLLILQELVDLKTIKDKVAAEDASKDNLNLHMQYLKRKPLTWEEAKKFLNKINSL